MKKLQPSLLLTLLGCCLTCATRTLAQTAPASLNVPQTVLREGLRSVAGKGSFPAAAFLPDGSLVLLLDQGDGLRLLKTDGSAATVLASAQMGATGDAGVALAVDPAGNVYVAGTSSSGTLAGSAGVPFPAPADSSINSFLAKFDAKLHPVFLTFLGAGRTAVTGVAATADAAFVTGITFSSSFPVTAAGVQQNPADGSSENGFAERFSADGASLVYATYLTGANGNTMPAAITADSGDLATIAGATSAPGFPTVVALQPEMLGDTSGFVAGLTATGDGLRFSTFVPGSGLTGLALDPSAGTLLATGDVALGQFPVATVAAPLTSASYQTLLRVGSDGQTIVGSVLLLPGKQSFPTADSQGGVWISGSVLTPLFPGAAMPYAEAGDSFLLHVTADNAIDQTLRLGGLPIDNPGYAALTTKAATPAVNGSTVAVPGTVSVTASASLLTSQRFDLPLVNAPSAALPQGVADLLPSAAACGTASQCTGKGALLAIVSTASPAEASLGMSVVGLKNALVRNAGSTAVSGLVLTASGYSVASDCPANLPPSSACGLELSGSGPGSLTISSSNAGSQTVTLPSSTVIADPLTLSQGELDFGILTAGSVSRARTVTINNLSTSDQTFLSSPDGTLTGAGFSFAETTDDCPGGAAAGQHVLPAGADCRITLGLTVSSSSANDGPISADWKIGDRDLLLTGFPQAAAVNLSAPEVDFGTLIAGVTPALSRYLYLSNNSDSAVEHAAVRLAPGGAFTVEDDCPSSLEPHTVCRLTLDYAATVTPSSDSLLLTIDSASVPVTGSTVSAATATGSVANPFLSVSPAAISFATPVVVTGVSSDEEAVTLSNSGDSPIPLTLAVSGDFGLTNGCAPTLAAGASCTVLIAFTPSQPGPREGLLNITAGSAFTPTVVALSGTGMAILPANNGVLSLGQTIVGEPLVQWYKVAQAFPSLTVASNSGVFGVVLVEDLGYGHGTIAPGSFAASATGTCANCWLGVKFLPTSNGTAAGTLAFSSAAGGQPYVLEATGTALPASGVLLTPVSSDFGPIPVSSVSAPSMFTLTNASSAAASITSVTATGDFSILAETGGGATCAGTLQPTASCVVEVQFAPTATGQRAGNLSVVSSAGTVSVALGGYGLADPGLAISPASLLFAAVPGAAATEQSVSLHNTGASVLSVGAVTVAGPGFAASSGCASLAAGASCTVPISFTPQSGPAAGSVMIPVTSTVNGQSSTAVYTVPLRATETAEDAGLEIVPDTVNFGAGPTGQPGSTREFTLNNLSGKTLAVRLDLPRQFPLASPSACATLAAGASCSLSVTVLPQTAGALTGSVLATGTASDGSSTEALGYLLTYGTGTGILAISGLGIPNAPLDFGTVSSGESVSKTLTLTNSGSAPVTVRRLTSEPPFLATSNCGSVLQPGDSCVVTLTYAPVFETIASAGARPDAGTLVIESDAASSPDIVDLIGQAMPVISPSPASSAVLAAFSLSQGSLTFPNTPVGNASAAQAVTLLNTGTTVVHLTAVTAPADFAVSSACGTLLPGASCSFDVTFTPGAASKATLRSGALEIASDAGTSLEFITLLGVSSASPLTLSPSALDFGTVNVGAHDALSVTVTSHLPTPITFGSITASGDYSVSAGSCPAARAALPTGASCTLSVTFSPTASGNRAGTLSLASNATELPLAVALTGNGVEGSLSVSPGALAFGSIQQGATSNLTVTVLNGGTASVTGIATGLSGANATDFAVTRPCSTDTLAPNQGCTMTVSFTPAASGARAATLTLTSSDPQGPAKISLTGTGIAAGSFTLTVNGGSAANATVASGVPATFALQLTPSGGFSGNVALTCAPIKAGQYASCSLLASTLTLNGAAQASTATLNTITSAADVQRAVGLGLMLLSPLLLTGMRRRTWQRLLSQLLLVIALCSAGVGFTGCGGGTPKPGNSKLRYTPAGTYQYQVTASSTSGTPISSSVTLNLTVQ